MRLASRSSRDQPGRRRGVSGWFGARAQGAEDKKPKQSAIGSGARPRQKGKRRRSKRLGSQQVPAQEQWAICTSTASRSG